MNDLASILTGGALGDMIAALSFAPFVVAIVGAVLVSIIR